MSNKTKYCGNISGENIYRYYNTQDNAVQELKKLAIKRYGDLTDISIWEKIKNKWSRIAWVK